MTAAPRAKKSLGQHFLKDAKTSARIVDLLRIGPEDRVLEIGPGPGAITGIIHERGPAEFRLIEKDSYWAAHHAELERPAPAVQVLNADALAFPWESLEGPWKIISNLPYNVGSPLMWDIVSRTPDLTRAVFMVQKEVADRLSEKPGSKIYGTPSVKLAWYGTAERVGVIGRNVFWPAPNVDSALVLFKRYPGGHTPAADNADGSVVDRETVFRLIDAAFGQRRKTLHAALKKIVPSEAFEKAGIDPTRRGETLTIDEFVALARALDEVFAS